ncbi:hypothetical protein METBIDRAFT_30371 [Metschnikowia bicuspidata var. bicuspidata NRRL YB-4993]|uniref:Uncharacterized protein n=1 Tax=Metschnikowia bicuspidata var. bicuspidata NRRL YB-4993 TaxID=869754 RepID=A0A1A0HJ38_9ASCO|nr:hypothetical protein METBIDRAFT_30371 [Metschnikowia bicuspidata var. bicuspidata NRRL YB-4993]OBA24016.1 hypothetical protein METBIDRAFT_30371 [Metschnikowia bicuspidata var. bicuspidata NRRL YB-4993]
MISHMMVFSRVAGLGPGPLVARTLPRPSTMRAFSTVLPRRNSKLPESFDPKKNLPSQGEWKHLKQHIPGEAEQTNTVRDRIPMFPLGKENVPTLLPRPGVPRVGPNMPFSRVIQILKSKVNPELIYESEPHRLYFLGCFCCAVMFTIYGCVLLEYAWFNANKKWDENEQELALPFRRRQFGIDLLTYGSLGAVALFAAYHFATFPTRLMRRIWYLPGPVEHIKFTSYPLIPGRPTPMYTVPLEDLARRDKARVWTGKGFYGTADKSLFFFVLKEKSTNKNWIVDRKGFFWSDGRVFDLLFGKETLAEAEAGIPYDEQIGIIHREVKKKKKELRAKHGIFYQFKLGAQEAQKDLKSATSYAKTLAASKKPKGLPKDKE